MKLREKITVVFLFINLFSYDGTSHWDYSLGGGARSLPIGLSVFSEVGHNLLLWGEKIDNENEYNYGYLRPSLQLSTSGLVTKPGVFLDVFPISFFGLTLGSAYSWRFTKLDTIDCSSAHCGGGLQRTILKTKLLLGYEAFFLAVIQKLEFLFPMLKDRGFADESSTLVGQKGYDRVWFQEYVLGYTLSEKYKVGMIFDFSKMLHSQNRSDQKLLFMNRAFTNWSLVGGAGLYQSSTQLQAFTGFILMEWQLSPSYALD